MFTQGNKPLLQAAASIDFKFMKNGAIAYRKHTKHELGLYFIKQAVERHGNRYGYSKVTYVNSSTKVILQCEEHGDFTMAPHNHLKGKGCKKCAGMHSPTTEEFIKKAREVHGDKYDYSSAQYNINREKIEICCPIPGHGSFFPTPSNHLRGSGCPKCAGNYTPSTEEFIKKARDVHGDKYDYNKVQYISARKKIEIKCQEHGPFSQAPDHHLNGSGCPKCAGKYSPTTEEFIKKARDVHGDKYDYSSSKYISTHEKLEIKCLEHGPFFQAPADHLNFHGCPRCAGKNHNILYLLKCNETGWYKIGITTDNVQKRIISMGGNLEKVHHVILNEPRKHEAILHKRYEHAREFNLFVRNGNTEFFSLTESQAQEIINYMNEIKNG